jgi:hypothetical protein
LGGQVHVDLDGIVGSDKRTGGLRATFPSVPDAFVSKFVLTMPGGRRSLLENSTDICRGAHRATVSLDAHNGRISDSEPRIAVKGCARGKGNGHRRHGRGRGGGG